MRILNGRSSRQPRASRAMANGIIEYHWMPSDDGRYAVVEFVARDRKALAAILKDARTVKAFEKGKDKKDDIERELKIYRKDFSLEEGKKP